MRQEPAIIFVVEDDPASRRLVHAVLEPNGYRIAEAEEFGQARAFLSEVVPALVLLDLRLPGGSGIDLLAHIRARPELRSVPVVALTAHAMKEDEARCREAGFDQILLKPLDTRLLRCVVEQAVTRGRGYGGREDFGSG